MATVPDWRHVEGMETQVRVLVVSNLYLTDYCCTTPQNTYSIYILSYYPRFHQKRNINTEMSGVRSLVC